ncbi:Pre-rRNA-processing protein ipi3 [Spiromyces aspiralis]|uniref:Pre-rRNA-processing protein ipi3 n=1 Tax=Spiromyces aspiralis TaxID=68401 RepID=A0ACC1HQA9_9FUNG|nr:Pre-rRNA-processing protein ipi3 [Spiromyces aspiralis]
MFTEVVIASAVDASTVLHDIRTGVRLGMYNGLGTAHTHSLAFPTAMESQSAGMPGWVLALPGGNKPVWQLYPLCRGDRTAKQVFPCPERLSCAAASPDGTFVAAGSYEGRVYVWTTGDGVLLRTWEAHYGGVTCVRFADDGLGLVTAGQDGVVNVWAMSQALDLTQVQGSDAIPVPVLTLSDHTLPVTDVQIGSGSGAGGLFTGKALIYTVSQDHTCKAWRLSMPAGSAGKGTTLRPRPLTTWLFPVGLMAVAVDLAETCMFCGGADGKIYQVDLYQQQQHHQQQQKQHSDMVEGGPLEAVLGKRGEDVINVDPDEKGQVSDNGQRRHGPKMYIGHEDTVNSLALSMDGTLLVSGSSDGSARVWDTASRQCLRIIHQPGPGESATAKSATAGPDDGRIGRQTLATHVLKGISSVAVVLAPPELGGAHSVAHRVVGGANTTATSAAAATPDTMDALKSGAANRAQVVNPVPMVAPLKRVPRVALDLTSMLSDLQSTGSAAIGGGLERSTSLCLSDTRRSINDVLGDIGEQPFCYSAGPYESQVSMSRDWELIQQFVTETMPSVISGPHASSSTSGGIDTQLQKPRDEKEALRRRVEQLEDELTRLQDHQFRINKLNDELYQATISEFMRNRKGR